MIHLLNILILFFQLILSISGFSIQVFRLALLTARELLLKIEETSVYMKNVYILLNEKYEWESIKAQYKKEQHTYTLENIDNMVGCFPLFLVTLVLTGDSKKISCSLF